MVTTVGTNNTHSRRRGGFRQKIPHDTIPHYAPFELYLISQSCSPDTTRGYLGVLTIWFQWCRENGVDVTHASQDDVARWLVDRRDRSRNTVRNNIIALRAYFRHLIARGLRTDDPTKGMKLPRVSLPPVQPYTREEIQAFLDAVRSKRDRAILLLFLSTGLRLAELTGIAAQDINWAEGTIRIYGKGGKYRLVAPGELAMQALREYLDVRTDSIWAVETTAGIRTWLARLAKRAGVKANAHRFRHTFATGFLEAGGSEGSLQLILGHSGLGMTLHYAHAGREKVALRQQRQYQSALRLLQGMPLHERMGE